LHAQSPLAVRRKGWSPTVSITLDPGRGIRLRCAWNSPQRRWFESKVKPATACTLPFAAIFAERPAATQEAPRSIAAQLPFATRILPAANTGAASSNAARAGRLSLTGRAALDTTVA